jgi:hypothetical protein
LIILRYLFALCMLAASRAYLPHTGPPVRALLIELLLYNFRCKLSAKPLSAANAQSYPFSREAQILFDGKYTKCGLKIGQLSARGTGCGTDSARVAAWFGVRCTAHGAALGQ